MRYVVLVFGVLISAMSAWGIVRPAGLMALVINTWRKSWGLPFAVGVRLVLGTACLLAAEASRFPAFFRVFGYLALIAAIAIPIVGKERLDRLIAYFQQAPAGLMRAWLLLGLVFGLFLVYGVL